MGYYTELELNVFLNASAPFDILKGLTNGEILEEAYHGNVPVMASVADTPPIPRLNHPFAQSKRWDQIFHANTTLIDNNLIIKCNIKAYDEIYEQLIDWLKPYIISGVIKTRGEDESEWTTNFYA